MIFKPIEEFANHPLVQALCSWALPVGGYVVCGSAPAFAQGALDRPIGDLDLIVLEEDKAWQIISKKGPVEIAGNPPGTKQVSVKIPMGDQEGRIECYTGWYVFDPVEIICNADFAQVGDHLLPIASIDDVIAYKRYLNRDKDRPALEAIAEYAGLPSGYFIHKGPIRGLAVKTASQRVEKMVFDPAEAFANHPLVQEVCSWNLPKEEYIILGSAAAFAWGVPGIYDVRPMGDLDLVFLRKKAWKEICKNRPVEIMSGMPGVSAGTQRVAVNVPVGDEVVPIECLDRWQGKEPSDFIRRANFARVGDHLLPIASLYDILAYKRQLNRVKDRPDIEALERYLDDHPHRLFGKMFDPKQLARDRTFF